MLLDGYGWVSVAVLQRRLRVSKTRATATMMLLMERGHYRLTA